VGDTPAFFPQLPPVRTATLPAGEPVLTPDVPPDRYLLLVRINWETPAGLPDPLFTEYLYIVDVL
jgi:hypothetical protein